MITGYTLYISGLTAVIKRWSCILPSKQWKCLPHCSWLCLHWRRRRIKIRQKMWWELLLSRVIHSKFFPLSPLKKQQQQRKNKELIYSLINGVFLLGQPVFTSWSANCRGCSLSAKKLFPCQGGSDFLAHWLPWFVVKQFGNDATVRLMLRGVRFSMQLCCQWVFFLLLKFNYLHFSPLKCFAHWA